jgi:hypothetical protein
MHAYGLPLALIVLAFGATALAEPVKTSKERLSDKASDEQRVDDCHVPVQRRGAVVRPDCPQAPSPPASTGGRLPAPR